MFCFFKIFYCRIHKLSVITEDLGAFSTTVLSGLSPPFHCYVCVLFEYATNHHGQLLDIRKFFHSGVLSTMVPM